MILITGATGTSGREITKAVAATGKPFKAMVRNPAKAADLQELGAKLVQGDFTDPASLVRACTGCDHVLLNSGPTSDLEQLQKNMIDAARKAGVEHVVKFSVGGADRPGVPVRFIQQHYAVEQYLMQSGLGWTMLRPTFFMQNLLSSAATIKSQGAIYMPAGDGKAPYNDTRDIADVAALTLTQPHAGKVYTLTGPEDLGGADMARLISQAIGKPVKYVAVTSEQAKASLLSTGIPEWNVDGMLELMKGIREGWMAGPTDDYRKVTGRPPRTFAQFAMDHRDAFLA